MIKKKLHKALRFLESVDRGDMKTVRYYIDKGVDIHVNEDQAIRRATFFNHFEIVKMLIDKGADVHIFDDFLLLLSVRNRYEKITKLLIDHEADCNKIVDVFFCWKDYNAISFLIKAQCKDD